MSDNKRQPRTFNLDDLDNAQNDPPELRKPQKSKSITKKPSAKSKVRKPRVVKDAALLQATPDEAAQRANLPALNADGFADSLTPPPPPLVKKRFRWSRILWLGITGLISLGIGLWVDQLIRDLFIRQDWLGWLAVAFAGLLVIAAIAIVFRELMSLRRMAGIDDLRNKASLAIENDDAKSATAVVDSLQELYQNRPDTARGRASLEEHRNQIIDGSDLITLAERDLLKPLDDKARALVMGSAKRVSVVTAVSPRALVDVGYVLVENARLIRRLSELYGGGHPP